MNTVLKNDFDIASELVTMIIEREPDIPASHPMGTEASYLLARQVRSLAGIIDLCALGNDHAAVIILRAMLEDLLLIWYFEVINDAPERWFYTRPNTGKKYAEKLKTFYASHESMMERIEKFESTMSDISDGENHERWENRLRNRMDTLAEKLGEPRPSDNKRNLATGIFLYDILYDRYSHWTHPTGMEMGRYVQLYDDDYHGILLNPYITLIQEALYNGVMFAGASFVKYLNLLHEHGDGQAQFLCLATEVDKWLQDKLGTMSFLKQETDGDEGPIGSLPLE